MARQALGLLQALPQEGTDAAPRLGACQRGDPGPVRQWRACHSLGQRASHSQRRWEGRRHKALRRQGLWAWHIASCWRCCVARWGQRLKGARINGEWSQCRL